MRVAFEFDWQGGTALSQCAGVHLHLFGWVFAGGHIGPSEGERQQTANLSQTLLGSHVVGRGVGTPHPNGKPGRLRIYKGHFEDHIDFDRTRHDRDWKEKKHLIEATFGWSITAHKAQGSQWENVIVWDDGLGRSELDRRRWLYTAITRAERGLVLLA